MFREKQAVKKSNSFKNGVFKCISSQYSSGPGQKDCQFILTVFFPF